MVIHSLKLAPSFQVINTKQFAQKLLFLNTEPLWGNIYKFELRSVQENNFLQRWIQNCFVSNIVLCQAVEAGEHSKGIGLKPDSCFRTGTRGVVL